MGWLRRRESFSIFCYRSIYAFHVNEFLLFAVLYIKRTMKRSQLIDVYTSVHVTYDTYTITYIRSRPVITRPYIDPPPSVPPTIQQFSFTKLPMNAGEFANLQCIVPTGDLPLNIRWSYPGEEMGGSSGVLAKKVADRVSMLMISVITARHAGEYVCTAENAAGTVSHSTTLTVNGSGLSSVPREI